MVDTIVQARTAYVKGTVGSYGARRRYAETCTESFGDGWWLIPMKGPVSENEAKVRELIRAEKKACTEAFKAVNYSNPYQPWSEVIKLLKGEDKRGAGANAPRDIYDRLKVELTKLYKAVRNDDNADTEALASCNWHIGAAMTAIGIDLADLNIEG
jgi:hypothetical protein